MKKDCKRDIDYAIIGIVGLPANYGGFETLVENLVDNGEHFITPGENEKKAPNIMVFCSSKTYKNKIKFYKNARLVYLPLKANGINSIFYDILGMILTIFYKPKALLVLGVSGAIFFPLLKLFYKGKIVTNIDGLEWQRAKWGYFTKRFLKLSERIAVKMSDIVIADNEAIAEYVAKEYSAEANVIAYGGDHAFQENLTHQNKGYALALCRIEPENNVDMILDAFSQSSMELFFVGNWDNSSYGRTLKNKYSKFSNIKIIEPVYDVVKLSVLRGECSVYVHGHSAGGTNPSLVEMMHFGKPILCFDCSYNRATTENKALYFDNANSLNSIIMSRIYEHSEVGKDMKEIAKRRYVWRVIQNQYFSVLKT